MNRINQTRISLKNIKHSEFASEETHCYQASVYFDGKKIGTTSNQGFGGCDDAYADKGKESQWADMLDYIKTIPPVASEYFDDGLTVDLELICGELVNDHLLMKDAQKITRGKIAFFEGEWDGSYRYYTTKGRDVRKLIAHIRSKHPNATILNQMPLNDIAALIGSV